jgi:hypothetical protein
MIKKSIQQNVTNNTMKIVNSRTAEFTSGLHVDWLEEKQVEKHSSIDILF